MLESVMKCMKAHRWEYLRVDNYMQFRLPGLYIYWIEVWIDNIILVTMLHMCSIQQTITTATSNVTMTHGVHYCRIVSFQVATYSHSRRDLESHSKKPVWEDVSHGRTQEYMPATVKHPSLSSPSKVATEQDTTASRYILLWIISIT